MKNQSLLLLLILSLVSVSVFADGDAETGQPAAAQSTSVTTAAPVTIMNDQIAGRNDELLGAVGTAASGMSATNCDDAMTNIGTLENQFGSDPGAVEGFCACSEDGNCSVRESDISQFRQHSTRLGSQLESACSTSAREGQGRDFGNNTLAQRYSNQLISFGEADGVGGSIPFMGFGLESACQRVSARIGQVQQELQEADQEAERCSNNPNCIGPANLANATLAVNNPQLGAFQNSNFRCGPLTSSENFTPTPERLFNINSSVKFEVKEAGTAQERRVFSILREGQGGSIFEIPIQGNDASRVVNNISISAVTSLINCAAVQSLNDSFTDYEDVTPRVTNQYAPGVVCIGQGSATKDYVACKQILDRMQMLTIGRLGFQAFQQVSTQVGTARIQADTLEAQAQGQSVTTGLEGLERTYNMQGNQAMQQMAANGAEMGILWAMQSNFPTMDKWNCENDTRLGMDMQRFVDSVGIQLGFWSRNAQGGDTAGPEKSAFKAPFQGIEGKSVCEYYKTTIQGRATLNAAFMNGRVLNALKSRMMMAGVQAGLNGLQAFLANRMAKDLRNSIEDLDEREENFQAQFDEDLLINQCAVDPQAPGCDGGVAGFEAPMGFTMGGSPLGGGGGSGGTITQGAFNAVGAGDDIGSPAANLPNGSGSGEVLAGGLQSLVGEDSGSVRGENAGSGRQALSGTGGGGGGGGGGASASGGTGGANGQAFNQEPGPSSGGLGEGSVSEAGGGAGGGWLHRNKSGGGGKNNSLKNPFRKVASTKQKILNFNQLPGVRGNARGNIFDRISQAHQGAVKDNRLLEYEIK